MSLALCVHKHAKHSQCEERCVEDGRTWRRQLNFCPHHGICRRVFVRRHWPEGTCENVFNLTIIYVTKPCYLCVGLVVLTDQRPLWHNGVAGCDWPCCRMNAWCDRHACEGHKAKSRKGVRCSRSLFSAPSCMSLHHVRIPVWFIFISGSHWGASDCWHKVCMACCA